MKRIMIICLSLALLFACVPTPEEEFVSHKDADEMLENAAVDDVPVVPIREQFPTAPDSADELTASDGTMYSYPCKDNADSPEFLRYGLRLQTNDNLTPLFFDVRITDPDNPNTTENGKDAQKSSYLGFMDDRNRAHGGDGQTRIAIRNPDEPTELSDYPQVTYLPKQAIEDAKQFLADVGLNDIAPDATALVFDGAQTAYGYRINCVRTFDGINGTALHAATYLDMNERYAPEWDYEEIELYIDAQGVYDFGWGYPVCVTETLKDATKLLPFEKILETFKSRMWTENAVWIVTDLASAGGDEQGFCTTGLDFEITRITLSLQRVMEPNRFDSGMLVPVWNFWGVKRTIDTHKTTGEQKTIVRDDRMTNPFLSINAIDGSVIDPRVGY